jgi:hypothetical protein
MLTCRSTEDWLSFLSLLQNCESRGCDKLFHEQYVAQLCKWNVLLCFHGNSCYVTHTLPTFFNKHCTHISTFNVLMTIIQTYFPVIFPLLDPK